MGVDRNSALELKRKTHTGKKKRNGKRTKRVSNEINVPFFSELNYITIFSPYRTIKALRYGYKDQSVNATQGSNSCLFCDAYETHKYTVQADTQNFLSVKPWGTYSTCWALKELRRMEKYRKEIRQQRSEHNVCPIVRRFGWVVWCM